MLISLTAYLKQEGAYMSELGRKSGSVLSKFLRQVLNSVRKKEDKIFVSYERAGRSDEISIANFLIVEGRNIFRNILIFVTAHFDPIDEPKDWREYHLRILSQDKLLFEGLFNPPLKWREMFKRNPNLNFTDCLLAALLEECVQQNEKTNFDLLDENFRELFRKLDEETDEQLAKNLSLALGMSQE